MKSKKEKIRPIDAIDLLAEQSLKNDESKEQWLDTLRELRDEINIQIENVEDEIQHDDD